MSLRETPEQREIRRLRSQISSMTSQIDRQDSKNAALQRDLQRVRREQEAENRRAASRIKELQNQQRAQAAAQNAKVRELDEQIRRKERLQNEKIRQMQSQHQADLSALDRRHRKEQEGLRQEIQQNRAQMQSQMNQLRQDTDRQLREQQEENRRNLAQVQTQLQSQITSVDRKVESLAQQIQAQRDGNRELAQYWSQEAQRLYRQLRDTFRPQLFAHERTRVIERNLANAKESLEGGQYEASITAGRTAFYDALDMKADLAEAEFQWNYWYNAVKSREAALLESLQEAQRRVYTYTMGGETITDDAGLDYWTNGQLSVLMNRVADQRRKMEAVENWTTEELQKEEEILRGLLEELALIENAAHINVAMSIARFEMASRIGDILDDGFMMTDADGDYFNRENRDEYHAVFENPRTREQIAVVITPLPDEAGIVTNHIELIVGNRDNDPLTRERISQAVAGKLRESGIDHCAFPCAQRYGDNTIEEVARVGDIEAVASGQESARARLPQSTESTGRPDLSRIRKS